MLDQLLADIASEMSLNLRNTALACPFQPTPEQREMVTRLTGLLVPEEQICRDWIKPPIAVNTLRKHFKDELKHGRQRLAARLKDMILQHAMRGSLRAMIYLTDRLGDLPAPKFRGPEDMVPQRPVTVVIKGGLPTTTIEGNAEVVGDDQEPPAET